MEGIISYEKLNNLLVSRNGIKIRYMYIIIMHLRLPKCWAILFCYLTSSYLSTTPIEAIAQDHSPSLSNRYTAYVNITYLDPETNHVFKDRQIIHGHYGHGSIVDHRTGVVVHVRSANNLTDGCSPPVNVPGTGEKWIALVKRGDCSFQTKITNAAINSNASAVVIYDYEEISKDGFVMNDRGNKCFNYIIMIFLFIPFY